MSTTYTFNEKASGKIRFQLIDPMTDIPVDSGDLSAMTLDLFDESTGDALNSRSAQNVLNANNVTVENGATITGATAANPVVLTTSAAHKLEDGDTVYISSVVGMTELNSRAFTVHVLTSTTISLVGEDGTSHTAYVSGGTMKTGVVEWAVQADDNPIHGTVAAGSYETHKAEFQATWASGQATPDYTLKVKSLSKIS